MLCVVACVSICCSSHFCRLTSLSNTLQQHQPALHPDQQREVGSILALLLCCSPHALSSTYPDYSTWTTADSTCDATGINSRLAWSIRPAYMGQVPASMLALAAEAEAAQQRSDKAVIRTEARLAALLETNSQHGKWVDSRKLMLELGLGLRGSSAAATNIQLLPGSGLSSHVAGSLAATSSRSAVPQKLYAPGMFHAASSGPPIKQLSPVSSTRARYGGAHSDMCLGIATALGAAVSSSKPSYWQQPATIAPTISLQHPAAPTTCCDSCGCIMSSCCGCSCAFGAPTNGSCCCDEVRLRFYGNCDLGKKRLK